MEKAEVNGIQLAYERRGKGIPMVLLHGYPLDHHLWDEVVPLLENTFDLVLPDLRGFGESSTVNSFYAMEDFAADIGGLLDQLGVGKASPRSRRRRGGSGPPRDARDGRRRRGN